MSGGAWIPRCSPSRRPEAYPIHAVAVWPSPPFRRFLGRIIYGIMVSEAATLETRLGVFKHLKSRLLSLRGAQPGVTGL